jgi:hypothetical protein
MSLATQSADAKPAQMLAPSPHDGQSTASPARSAPQTGRRPDSIVPRSCAAAEIAHRPGERPRAGHYPAARPEPPPGQFGGVCQAPCRLPPTALVVFALTASWP